MPVREFKDIIDPVTPDVFFAQHYGRAMLHVPGQAQKFAALMSWDKLNELLDMHVWTPTSLQLVLDRQPVDPEQFCTRSMSRNGQLILRPQVDKVMALARRGASLILKDIDTLSHELAAASRLLETTLGARIGLNLYCSWEKHQAFNSHFDNHDVYVFHIAGEKTWNIYRGRIEDPIEHPLFSGMPLDQRNQLKGPVEAQVTLKPGSFLYLPRGTFHDALALSPGSIHITCSVVEPTGMDWLSTLIEMAVQDPVFRATLPRSIADAAQSGAAETQARLADQLAALARSPQALDIIKAIRARRPAARPPFSLSPDTSR